MTPLHRLSQEFSRPIYIKRDDLLGPAGGGNKTRKLEFILGDALEGAAVRLVTVGGPQSNHARLTAVCGRMIGLEPHLLLLGARPSCVSGNLLINELVGAQLHFIAPGPLGQPPTTREAFESYVQQQASARVGDHYYVPLGGSNALGALGFVDAAIEVEEQLRARGHRSATVVVAAGSGGTLAGLEAGFRLVGSETTVVGIDVGAFWEDFGGLVRHMANQAASLLGAQAVLDAQEAVTIETAYVGPGYGVATNEGSSAIRRALRTEGVLLDPTYTSKAFAGMLDLLECARGESDRPVVFWHTGGGPGLFAT
jgi:D-cysteine desulfhydrase